MENDMATLQGIWGRTSQDEVTGKEFHPRAAKLVNECSQNYLTSLKLQSQIIAHKNKAEIVLSKHVEEAFKKLNLRNTVWFRELTIIIGSALFGAFVQGFVSELSSGNTFLIAVYTILGFSGMFLVVWAIRD
jgi:hypothetical protein